MKLKPDGWYLRNALHSGRHKPIVLRAGRTVWTDREVEQAILAAAAEDIARDQEEEARQAGR